MIGELLAAAVAWQSGPQLPVPRTEVVGAAVRGEIYIVGGYNADGSSSRRVDVYAPATRRWRRGPDLPVAVNHAMAPRTEAGSTSWVDTAERGRRAARRSSSQTVAGTALRRCLRRALLP